MKYIEVQSLEKTIEKDVSNCQLLTKLSQSISTHVTWSWNSFSQQLFVFQIRNHFQRFAFSTLQSVVGAGRSLVRFSVELCETAFTRKFQSYFPYYFLCCVKFSCLSWVFLCSDYEFCACLFWVLISLWGWLKATRKT